MGKTTTTTKETMTMIDRIIKMKRTTRFLAMFLAIGILAGCGFFVLCLPFIPFGWPIHTAIGGAIGCGFATGFVNGIMIALID